jgi:uncharacterized membrane protein HdeD (DUF308 family)
MLIGGTLSIADTLFMLALMGFAIWKTSWIRVILSICLIIWGVFAMSYDIKVSAPLLAAGTVLFIMGIMNVITKYREET